MIIVVDDDKRVAVKLCSMFYKMGFHSSPSDFATLESHLKGEPYECVLVANADSGAELYNFAFDFRKAHKSTPLVILRNKNSQTNLPLLKSHYDRVLNENSYSTTVALEILDLWRKKCGCEYANIIAGGARIKCDSPFAYFRGLPINVTPTERMIIKYLILTSPRMISHSELLETCFHPERTREVNNIATHISSINKKALRMTGKKMISHKRGEGYYIPLNPRRIKDIRKHLTDKEIQFYELQYEGLDTHIL